MVIPRAPLVPEDDPTTLFTGSGMQPLLPYLLGADHPAGRRLADSQTCLRVQDIEEVGDNRHTTFFEMLGNWSLGDYFKDRAAAAGLGLPHRDGRVGPDPDLRVVLHRGRGTRHTEGRRVGGDLDRAVHARRASRPTRSSSAPRSTAPRSGSQGARIAFYGKKNWWCRGGNAESMPVGEPGGPDTEVFYLFPEVEHDPAYGAHCHQNCDCGRFIEIGNSVFMEYRRTETGFEPLPRRNVDYGGGLARIAAASMDTSDVFRISLLWPIIDELQELSGRTYEDETVAMRVIADHLRGATFLAVDGVRPSNKAQGYVMRRLVRRAVRFAFDLGLEENFFPRDHPDRRRHLRRRLPRGGEHAATWSPCSSRRSRRSGAPCARASSSCAATGGRASPARSCSSSTTPSGSRSS